MNKSQKFLAALTLLGAVVLAGAVSQRSTSAQDGAQKGHGFEKANMDPGTAACTDFYQYANGGWLAANPIPAAEAYWGTMSGLQIWNETVLRNALDKASRADAQRSPTEQKIGDYWAACMDEPGIEAAGVKPVAADLKRIDALRGKRAIAGEIARVQRQVDQLAVDLAEVRRVLASRGIAG